MNKINVGIFIFDGAEVLDFAGPFEVFSVTSELNNYEPFDVFTVGKSMAPITAINGLSVNPKYSFETAPKIDILIMAGGSGTRKVMQDEEVLEWIHKVHQHTEWTLSICSGARFLAKLGLLDHQLYSTHHEVYDHLQELAPTGLPQQEKRFTQAGRIYTSGGISAGIDLSFHLVDQLLGREMALKTATYMEYDWDGKEY